MKLEQKRTTLKQKNQTNFSDWSAMMPLVPENGRKPASVYRLISQAIDQKKFECGAKLPPSRDLAKRFSISRATVVAAYEMLAADGYIITKRGSGSFVALNVPRTFKARISVPEREQKSAYHLCDLDIPLENDKAMSLFRRLLNNRAAKAGIRHYNYTDPRGSLELREALSAYLRQARGLNLDASQIFITSGTQQSLDLCLRCFFPDKATILVEDPFYRTAVQALEALGKTLEFLPHDKFGNDLNLPPADAILLNPSRQFPLGGTIDLTQRLNLLKWAKDNHAMIIEDDYDSEIRFEAMPMTAIQGLDETGSVIYFGTFSKTLFAGLQCAYMVVPSRSCERLMKFRSLVDRRAVTFVEEALADFINGGHYARHLRRSARIVKKNRDALVKGLESGKGKNLMHLIPPRQGLHLAALIDKNINDVALEAKLHKAGFGGRAISHYCRNSRENGLIMGYCGFSPELYEQAGEAISHIIANKVKI